MRIRSETAVEHLEWHQDVGEVESAAASTNCSIQVNPHTLTLSVGVQGSTNRVSVLLKLQRLLFLRGTAVVFLGSHCHFRVRLASLQEREALFLALSDFVEVEIVDSGMSQVTIACILLSSSQLSNMSRKSKFPSNNESSPVPYDNFDVFHLKSLNCSSRSRRTPRAAVIHQLNSGTLHSRLQKKDLKKSFGHRIGNSILSHRNTLTM